jgi:hypothetical protein
MTGFSERMARQLGRPVVAACSVRPPYTTLAVALTAGGGAAIGSVLGGPLLAGAVAGLAVIVAYVIVWFETRGSGTSVNMALVLSDDEVELVQLRPIGTGVVRTLRSIPLADVAGVHVDDGFLELKITIRTARDTLKVAGGKRGLGAAPPVVDVLRRRIAA